MNDTLRARLDALVAEMDPLAGPWVFDRDIRGVIAAAAAEICPDADDRRELIEWVTEWGSLTRVLARADVEEVSVNGPGDVWVSAGGRRERVHVELGGEDIELLLESRLAEVGVPFSLARPQADATLAGGWRIHAEHRCLNHGRSATFTVRRQLASTKRLDDLVRDGLLDAWGARLLRAAVQRGRSILVAGGMGCGKTTLVGALMREIPIDQRVQIIEEVEELPDLPGRNVQRSSTRTSGGEGTGGVGFDELLRGALRSAPDTLVVGEVRGKEAASLLEAMQVFRGGCLGTIHADDSLSALQRFVNRALEGGATAATVVEQVSKAVDLIVVIARDTRSGRRWVAEISVPVRNARTPEVTRVIVANADRWEVERPDVIRRIEEAA